MQQPGRSPSCSNQGGGLCGDGFSWYSDEEDISENEQQEIYKNPSGKL
jgi:hypothetical protein